MSQLPRITNPTPVNRLALPAIQFTDLFCYELRIRAHAPRQGDAGSARPWTATAQFEAYSQSHGLLPPQRVSHPALVVPDLLATAEQYPLVGVIASGLMLALDLLVQLRDTDAKLAAANRNLQQIADHNEAHTQGVQAAEDEILAGENDLAAAEQMEAGPEKDAAIQAANDRIQAGEDAKAQWLNDSPLIDPTEAEQAVSDLEDARGQIIAGLNDPSVLIPQQQE